MSDHSPWTARLLAALNARAGERAPELYERYAETFPAAYKERSSPEQAATDIVHLEAARHTQTARVRVAELDGDVLLHVYPPRERLLSDVIDVLHASGLSVADAVGTAVATEGAPAHFFSFRIASVRAHTREDFLASADRFVLEIEAGLGPPSRRDRGADSQGGAALSGGTTWIFLRHGESIANAGGWLSGWDDVPLTERGEAQALAAGVLLREHTIARCLTSDLGRAAHTARLALGERRVPTLQLGELRERNMGTFQGVSIALLAQDGRRATHLLPFDAAPPGGESRRQAVRRALAGLRHWDDGRPTLVVAHGSVLRGVIAAFDGVDALDGLPPTPNAEPVVRVGPVPACP